MGHIKRFLDWIKGFFELRCPGCMGRMDSVFDMEIDRLCYTCRECGEKWI